MSLSEDWLSSVCEDIRIPAVSPAVSKLVLNSVELQIRKIIQQGYKYHKRSKSSTMTVDDLNLALSFNRMEQVYGFSRDHNSNDLSSSNIQSNAALKARKTAKIKLGEINKFPVLKYPLLPELNLHWLAVDGIQPQIPENPISIVDNEEELNNNISKDLQLLYSRVTAAVLTNDADTLRLVYMALQSDPGLQPLLPYFSRFIYTQVKKNSKSLSLNWSLIKMIKSLVCNQFLTLEYYVQQILPALLTCIVASKLSSDPEDDHWLLRSYAADLLAYICLKYTDVIHELQARVCKTYLDALEDDKSLSNLYGGIAGLQALGHNVIKGLLLPNLSKIEKRLSSTSSSKLSNKKYELELIAVEKCRMIILSALGKYVTKSILIPKEITNTLKDSSSSNMTAVLFELEEALVPYYLAAMTLTPRNPLDYMNLYI